MWTPRYSIKRTDFVIPLVPGLYKIHSIMRMLAGFSHKIVWHRWLIHQLYIILTLVCIVLASGYPFLLSYSKGELWNGAFVALNSTSTHWHAYQKHTRNIPETSEVGTPLYSGHFRWYQWCPHYRGSTVLLLHITMATAYDNGHSESVGWQSLRLQQKMFTPGSLHNVVYRKDFCVIRDIDITTNQSISFFSVPVAAQLLLTRAKPL